jgi:hypothetical protein
MIINTYSNYFGSRMTMIELHDDDRKYQTHPGQRWVPRCISFNDHPAKVGDIVTLPKKMTEAIGIKVAIVGAIRKFKENRKNDNETFYQVELLGIPRRWFETGFFLEYLQKEDEPYDRMKHGCRVRIMNGVVFGTPKITDF